MKNLIEKQTIEELENDRWQEPPKESSSLIKTCFQLRKKKIKDLSVEDLRVLIGQDIGLIYLIPIAIDVLKENPFVEGNYYEGDLLKSVLTSDKTFWKKNPNYKTLLIKKLELIMYNDLDQLDTTEQIKQELRQSYIEFKE
jgi:hypothetical protein